MEYVLLIGACVLVVSIVVIYLIEMRVPQRTASVVVRNKGEAFIHMRAIDPSSDLMEPPVLVRALELQIGAEVVCATVEKQLYDSTEVGDCVQAVYWIGRLTGRVYVDRVSR